MVQNIVIPGFSFLKGNHGSSQCILGWIPKQCEFTYVELCCNGPAFVAWSKWMFIFHFLFLNMEGTYFPSTFSLLLRIEGSLKRVMLNCPYCQIQCNFSYLFSIVRYCHLESGFVRFYKGILMHGWWSLLMFHLDEENCIIVYIIKVFT